MERNEISLHEVKIYNALRANKERWLTNSEVAGIVKDVALRTVRAHTLKLVKLGLIDQAEVFPAHRYRWSEKGEKRNMAYALRLEAACGVFGII